LIWQLDHSVRAIIHLWLLQLLCDMDDCWHVGTDLRQEVDRIGTKVGSIWTNYTKLVLQCESRRRRGLQALLFICAANRPGILCMARPSGCVSASSRLHGRVILQVDYYTR
jgi:hypothetical protein